MPNYLKNYETAATDAIRWYVLAVEELQESCEHATILEYKGHNDAQPIYTRVCEECGLKEGPKYWSSRGWDQLTGRAYLVGHDEFMAALPTFTRNDIPQGDTNA